MVKKSRKDSPKIDRRFQSKLKKILAILAEKNIAYDQLILFGSVARGDAREDSDLDLCMIIDDKKADLQAIQRSAVLWVAKAGIAADFVVTTSKSYKTDLVSPLLHQVRTYGIPLV